MTGSKVRLVAKGFAGGLPFGNADPAFPGG